MPVTCDVTPASPGTHRRVARRRAALRLGCTGRGRGGPAIRGPTRRSSRCPTTRRCGSIRRSGRRRTPRPASRRWPTARPMRSPRTTRRTRSSTRRSSSASPRTGSAASRRRSALLLAAVDAGRAAARRRARRRSPPVRRPCSAPGWARARIASASSKAPRPTSSSSIARTTWAVDGRARSPHAARTRRSSAATLPGRVLVDAGRRPPRLRGPVTAAESRSGLARPPVVGIRRVGRPVPHRPSGLPRPADLAIPAALAGRRRAAASTRTRGTSRAAPPTRGPPRDRSDSSAAAARHRRC